LKTSIVTSMYNKKQEVLDAIDNMLFPSLLNNASKDKELIILDDCSPLEKETKDLVEKYLPALKEKFGNVIFQRNPENLGFAKSYNKGMGLAKGDVYLIANDDLYFPTGSIDALAETLSESEDYGLIAPVTNAQSTWTYQYCKQAPKLKEYSKKEFETLEDFAKSLKCTMAGTRVIMDKGEYVSGFCLAVKSSVLKEVGAFDESFEFGQFEDVEFSKRLGQKYKIVVNPQVFVAHGGVKGKSQSLGQRPFKQAYYALVNGLKLCKSDYAALLKCMLYGLSTETGLGTVSEIVPDGIKK
jgi:GT2 family glycosyltransferase